MRSIKTYDILNHGTITGSFVSLSIIKSQFTSANDWPSARVVATVDPEVALLTHRFIVIGEGEEIPEGYWYLGTIVHENPRYIAHWAVTVLN